METEGKKFITLKSSDDQEFVVEESLAVRSATIKNMIESDCPSNIIPLPNIDSKTLTIVIEYLGKQEKYYSNIVSEANLFTKLPMDELLGLFLAAKYLEIKKLGDSIVMAMDAKIRGLQEVHNQIIITRFSDSNPREFNERLAKLQEALNVAEEMSGELSKFLKEIELGRLERELRELKLRKENKWAFRVNEFI